MGADIHMVVEKRHQFKDGREVWVGVNAFPYTTVMVYDFSLRKKYGNDAPASFKGTPSYLARSRNYTLFAALAGVRGSGPAPKGVPDDASDLALMEIENWGSDGHSHTWYLMSAAMPIFLRHHFNGDAVKKMIADGQSQEDLGRAFMAYFHEALDEEVSLDDYRLIVWFDN